MAFRHVPRHSLSELSSLSTLSELSTLSQASLTSLSPTDMISSLSYTSDINSGPFTSEPLSTLFPSATATGVPASTIDSQSSGDLGSASTSATASLTTLLSVTLTLPSTTIITTTFSEIPNSGPTSSTVTLDPLCAGQGIDGAATGVITSLVLTTAIGILIWFIFAVVRPRVPALYAAREWFVQPNLRPPPLRSTFWAFLFPPVPLIPDLSSHAPFPSDGQLAQRTLWVAFLLVLGWTIVGLVGVLPLYLVDTPCLGDSYPRAVFGGRASTLQDLSLLRLLKMYDEGTVSTTNGLELGRRAIVDGNDRTPAARTRLIILTVFVIVLFAFPALFKLLREWTNVLTCRRSWLEELHSADIVWLRADRAPGFQGWGEGRIKDLLVRCGLTSKLGGESTTSRSAVSAGRSASTRSPGPMRSLGGSGDEYGRRNYDAEVERAHDEGGEVDVHGVFTVVDTSRLQELIHERATVLESLEVAETYYIRSFQLSTSSPGSDDETSESEGRHSGPRISRPLPLGGRRRGRVEQLGPGEHGGPTPTSYVAPSQYYKLRSVNGITGGRITSSNDSLAFRISQRVIGSRFQEVTRESISFGRLPLGSKVRVGHTGELAAVPPTPAHGAFPSTGTGSESLGAFGPNHPPLDEESWEMTDVPSEAEFARTRRGTSWLSSTVVGSGTGGPSKAATVRESVASPKLIRKARESSDPYARRETLDTFGRRDTSDEYRRRATMDGRREPSATAPTPTPGRTSAARRRSGDHSSAHRQPVVRPVSGLDHSTLALVYDDIRAWRSRLKALNAEIAEAQQEAYTAIADGRNVKGWLFVGRNVRYLAGTESIEGRAKADIRWRELQLGEQGGLWSDLRYWAVVALVAVLLAGSLIPVAGLALAGAPDVAHYLPFLSGLSGRDNLGASIATTVAPALAATLFIVLALLVVNRAARFSGPASISAERLRTFKATFYMLTFVATAWIIAAGALIFGVEAFNTRSQRSRTVADGTTYIAVLLMVIILNAAVIAPGLQMLQPIRLWKVYQAKQKAITPRQRFRAIYPGSFNPTYASGCCVLAVIFASTFSLIFPLIGPPIVLLVLLSLIAYRYLVGYVWSRTNAPSTGGVLQLWLLRRFATLLALQPALLGLILLSRRLWILAGVLLGAALVIILIVEGYCGYRSRNPPERKCSPVVRDSLATFHRSIRGSRSKRRLTMDEDGTSLVSSPMERGGIPRGSIASVLDMMSITLNVMPSPNRPKDAVPIETEDIDDLVSTERAAHTHPDAAPMIPSTDHAVETAGLLYPPELLAPPPMIWLPNDRSGIARSEAYDLGRYHDLETVLDPGDYTTEGSSIGRRSNERTPTPKH
ncbi:Short transient receptor potential channel 7 [Rhizoctonia solani]|uniref:Short transient receptor potential channel 7 n=1 Tax=Rhizoctonia solani TaxID=456999 RepID=A0A0K6G1R0_9AGAM|nr:Short transient receptor potential channel 7 [Rhizoctonia solani]